MRIKAFNNDMRSLFYLRMDGRYGGKSSGAWLCSYAHAGISYRSLWTAGTMDFNRFPVAPFSGNPLPCLSGYLVCNSNGTFMLFPDDKEAVPENGYSAKRSE